MRTILIFILGLVSYTCFAQINLVPNGSFENITSCPNSFSQIFLASPWWNSCSRGSIITSDLFNSCDNNFEVGVPYNFAGYQEPYDGSGYAGFIGFLGIVPEYWGENIEVKLIKTIKANAQYRLCFQLSLADSLVSYGLSKLRFALTADSLLTIDTSTTPIGGVLYPSLNILDLYETSNTSGANYYNWVEICTDFTLNRDANYLTIGTLKQSALNTDTILINTEEPVYLVAYYYIDDVSLICITPTGCDDVGVEDIESQSIIHLFPNPSNKSITLQSPLIKSGSNLFLRDLSGRLIHQLKFQELNNYELSTQDLADGIYLVQIVGEDGRQVRENFVVQH